MLEPVYQICLDPEQSSSFKSMSMEALEASGKLKTANLYSLLARLYSDSYAALVWELEMVGTSANDILRLPLDQALRMASAMASMQEFIDSYDLGLIDTIQTESYRAKHQLNYELQNPKGSKRLPIYSMKGGNGYQSLTKAN